MHYSKINIYILYINEKQMASKTYIRIHAQIRQIDNGQKMVINGDKVTPCQPSLSLSFSHSFWTTATLFCKGCDVCVKSLVKCFIIIIMSIGDNQCVRARMVYIWIQKGNVLFVCLFVHTSTRLVSYIQLEG